MSIPHVLPEPLVVVQDPARCWAAAFDIWQRANEEHLQLTVGPSQTELIGWLSSGLGFLTRAGRATDSGVSLVGNIGLMRLVRLPSNRLTLDVLDRRLNDGYVYCAYYWRTRRGARLGHAVVIYGVEDNAILFSDPAPGRGLIREQANFFRRESETVILGTSVLVDLRRSVGESLSILG